MPTEADALADAIEQSIQHNVTVDMTYSLNMRYRLTAWSDDDADAADGSTEYSGCDAAGRVWRIRLACGTVQVVEEQA